MLDIQWLRKDLDSVTARLKTRGYDLDTALFNRLEDERKGLQTKTEELQAKRNSSSKMIGQLKSKGEDTSAIMAEIAGLGDELKACTERLNALQEEINDFILTIPNLPHESVPVGADENGNIEVRKWGTPATFDFQPKITFMLQPPWVWISKPQPICLGRVLRC